MEDLIPIIAKHNKETYLMPVSDVHNDKAVVLDNNKVKYVKAVMYRTVSNDFTPDEPFDYDMLYTLRNMAIICSGSVAISSRLLVCSLPLASIQV